ncbi:orotate phosphoribosyltransferase [Salinivirga cyanobacteriivorans]
MSQPVKEKIAQSLLQINAIQLEPSNPFVWASGMKSPIYCDNRKILSYPRVRKIVRDAFVDKIKADYPDVDFVAGVATGAIAHGALVAEALDLPFLYVRSEAKGHGMQNLVEGDAIPGKKVIVIEDLVSTGGSSVKAVEALRNHGMKVQGLIAIFTYGFQKAFKAFADANCEWSVLTDYSTLIDMAVEDELLPRTEMSVLEEWQADPENWSN